MTFATEKEAWDYVKRPKWDTVFALISEMIAIAIEKQYIKENIKKSED